MDTLKKALAQVRRPPSPSMSREQYEMMRARNRFGSSDPTSWAHGGRKIKRCEMRFDMMHMSRAIRLEIEGEPAPIGYVVTDAAMRDTSPQDLVDTVLQAMTAGRGVDVTHRFHKWFAQALFSSSTEEYKDEDEYSGQLREIERAIERLRQPSIDAQLDSAIVVFDYPAHFTNDKPKALGYIRPRIELSSMKLMDEYVAVVARDHSWPAATHVTVWTHLPHPVMATTVNEAVSRAIQDESKLYYRPVIPNLKAQARRNMRA